MDLLVADFRFTFVQALASVWVKEARVYVGCNVLNIPYNMCMCIYIYIYMYRERERGREMHRYCICTCICVYIYIYMYKHVYGIDRDEAEAEGGAEGEGARQLRRWSALVILYHITLRCFM